MAQPTTTMTAYARYRQNAPSVGGTPPSVAATTKLNPSTEERLAVLRAEREKKRIAGGQPSSPVEPSTTASRLAARRVFAASNPPPNVSTTTVQSGNLMPGNLNASPANLTAQPVNLTAQPTGSFTTTTPIPPTSVAPVASSSPLVQDAERRTTRLGVGTAGARTGMTNQRGVVGSVSSSTTPNPEVRPVVSGGVLAAGRTLPSRQGTLPPGQSTPASRRPSQMVIEKEKKTDYWKDVERTVQAQGAKLSGDDLNNVISRAMALGVVGDKKQRESISGPNSEELLVQLKTSMEQRLVELNGGRAINFDSLMQASNASTMDKILNLERAISTLESRKSKEEEEEKKRVQSKITELEQSLKALEQQKLQQREQNRRTMKLEIANLKEMMVKVQKEKDDEASAAAEAKALAAKMNRLEAALKLMNEDKKNRQVEDKDTLLLKRKLALFEQKLQEMESEKKMREEQDQSGALRDKLLLMEDKLAKMEKRKSVSMTLQMQQKMETVEKQLAMLRNERSGGHSDATNAKIAQKMAILEQQLRAMAEQKFIPSMVQDEETNALREHIKKLEESLLVQEKRMDEHRRKLEEERKRAHEKRMAEEEAFRQQALAKEKELMNRIQMMESRLKAGVVGGGVGVDPELIDRLKRLEATGLAGFPADLTTKFADMEKKLEATQRQLEEERKATTDFFSSGPKEGPELEAWQKDLQISWLKKANEELINKLEQTKNDIDKKMTEFKEAKFVGGGGAAVNKSGLSYADINAKLAEIQAKLFDPDTEVREAETLNIEYEKLITELEQTPEYQKEQEEIRNKWKKENEAPNKEAYDKVFANLKAMPDQKLSAVFKRKPELRFILRTSDQLLKAHANDFKQVSTQNLLLIEARALYHILPNFRKDQEQQVQFVQQLQQKIELEAGKPSKPAPPPIEPKKKVVIKTKKGGGGGSSGGGSSSGGGDSGGDGFLAELLQKRKRKE